MNQDTAVSAVHNLEQILFFTLLQIGIIIIAARVAGQLARRLGQPRAVGEIVAGLLLGPSLFGWVAPDVFALVFRSTDTTPISVISQIGLIMLMFQIGLEFDFAHLQGSQNKFAVLLVAGAGIVVPFVLGFLLGMVSAPALAGGINSTGYTLFMATALSITAVPILGRIMIEFDLTRTRVGVITISAAAINDAVGWTVLAAISAIVTAQFSPLHIAQQIGGLLLYVGVCWWAVRRIMKAIVYRFDLSEHALPQDLLAILLVIVFASAMLTSKLGIFAIFGGFMMGVLLHDQKELVAAWRNKVADLVTVFFLPIFFTYTGLRTNIGGLDTLALWGWCGLVLLLAVVGKYGGCYVAARLAGLQINEARNIAIMMNTRALMELVVVNLGYDLGVIPAEMFTMLVLMAIVSTVMTAPGLRRWLPRIGHTIPVGRDA